MALSPPSGTELSTEFRSGERAAAGHAGPRLHPAIRVMIEEALIANHGHPIASKDVRRLLREFADAEDPEVRRQTLFYRLWRAEGIGFDESDCRRRGDWAALVTEATDVAPGGLLEPVAEALIHRVVSDGWARRGYFVRSAKAMSTAIRFAGLSGASGIQSSMTASLGVVLALAGFVAEGLGVITRTAAQAIDCSSHSFIGPGRDLREERHQVVELADADEHTRNYRRAVVGNQVAASLLGPVEAGARCNAYLALTRCLCHIGETASASEIFSDVANATAHDSTARGLKYDRAQTVLFAARGDSAAALEYCADRLTGELRTSSVGLYMELLLDGMTVARRVDEPGWVIDHADDVEGSNLDGIGLMSTFAYRDLAWAYRRLGDRTASARCHRLARQGSARFVSRSGYSPFPVDSAPGVLRSARELHQAARRSHHKESVSLARGIGSVTHDVGNQLQSLEFLAGLDQWESGGVSTVRSIVTAIDDMLSGLLREVEADREIELTDVCLNLVVNGVLDRFRSTADRKQISLSTDLDGPLSCRSDRVALDRIVSNLVSNAIKYSPIGGEVQITATTLGESFVDLHIIDSGPGIPRDELDELFRWGGTLSSEPTAGETQQGIGLFTARRLALLTGASIRPHPRGSNSPSTMSVRLSRPGERNAAAG